MANRMFRSGPTGYEHGRHVNEGEPSIMKKLLWSGTASLAGLLAAGVTRRLVARLWPGQAQPPLNPADRRIDWPVALGWALASGVGAGVARLVSRRAAARGWEAATGSSPPGVASGTMTSA